MNILRVERLSKSFNKKKVVDDISLEVKKGEIVGLLGSNGAGKTTTFSLILGLISPDKGRIFLGKDKLTHLPMYLRARKGIAFLPQESSAFRRLSVKQNILAILEIFFHSNTKLNERLNLLLKELGLENLSEVKAYTLSGGERRRLEIARALVMSPHFLLLDEPFTGIDPIAVADIQRIILSLKNKGIGILVTDHNVRETLKITDRAYIIKNGRILKEGTPYEVASDLEVRKNYLGEKFSLN
ncbi:MAG: LPS export ABC transporter ATP-binding protein [Candidatus Aminicenantia bacterium]